MTETDPDIVVLRQKIHGLDASDYAAALRERLPDHEVALATTPAEERELVRNARVATGFSMGPELLDAAENLELFACVYAGTGHLDLEAFDERGVAVTNASGVHGPNIAEYVLGSMIAHARDFPRAWDQKADRQWNSYPTTEVYGSTVAVVGLGAIGETVVDRLKPFDVHTVGVRYSPEKGGPTDEVYGFDRIHEAVTDAEYVVLACPLTDATAGLIDDEVFRTMRADAVLVNVARGKVIDTDALVSALRSNAIGSAALDVTDPEPLPEDHPLWRLDDVTITPHNAGHTPDYFERCGDILAANIRELDATGGPADAEIENRVN
ncbi:D-2-hydroxyacid dehydrogenase [Haloparvum sedimenti]|uniref:D-2-hydroxyacid dehydrogenase n=1 Tax=Haloparvum sedimenti TaxID=1678448 RepID=UPI00071E932D|nr:D-2-hydroxyacid dehydrogenase [Haloparvum sedimenti]